MDANSYLDHMQLHQLVSGLVQATSLTSKIGQVPSATVPSSFKETHYGPDGINIAFYSTVTCGNGVPGNSQQAISTINHESVDPSGKSISSSVLTLDNQGQALAATTSINNRFVNGIDRNVKTDFSSVQWTDAATIHSGSVGISITDATGTALIKKAAVDFAGEKINAARFVHYLPETAGVEGAVNGYTEEDYQGATIVGNKIIGGTCTVTSKAPDASIKSVSGISINQLGQIEEVNSTNFIASSTEVRSKVVAKFGGIKFTPRNEILEGTLTHDVTDVNGNQLSHTDTVFSNQQPSTSTTYRYSDQQLATKTVMDFAGVSFNNALQVTGGATNISVYDVNNKLVSQTQVQRDGNGNVTMKNTKIMSPKLQVPTTNIVSDYANVQFGSGNVPISGTIMRTVTDLVSGVVSHSEEPIIISQPMLKTSGAIDPDVFLTPVPTSPLPKYDVQETSVTDDAGHVIGIKKAFSRPDGTLLKVVYTNVTDGKPAGVLLTLYSTDGKSPILTHELDISALSYDQSTSAVKGVISMKSLFQGTTLQSLANIVY